MVQRRVRKGRIIFHIDMNRFYAAVEMAHNPALKGKPVAIAGNPKQRRGIIVTSSIKARDLGVKTTMPLWEARQMCPDLVVLPPNFDMYREALRQMFKILADVTLSIEPVSIDEGYMDVTDVEHEGSPVDIAYNIHRRIKAELDLPSSLGIRSEEHTSELQSRFDLVCRLLLDKNNE